MQNQSNLVPLVNALLNPALHTAELLKAYLFAHLKDQKTLVGDFTKKIITHWELFEFSKEELKTIKELCQKPFSMYLLPRQKEGYKILLAKASKHLGSIKD